MITFIMSFQNIIKLIKTKSKPDRLVWLNSIDSNLKLHNYVLLNFENMSQFRKNNSTKIRLHVDATCLHDPGDVDEASAKHF